MPFSGEVMGDQDQSGIQITKEELAEKWVDDAMAEVAAAEAQRRVLPDTRTRLYYRGWFILALAGALAALVAWAILEPLFKPKSSLITFKEN